MQTLIVEYKPIWPLLFDDFKTKYLSILYGLEVVIEHVGSTAVLNMPAKDIIDIDIVYKHHNDFLIIKNRLNFVGYNYHGNQGVEGREVFKRATNIYDPLLDKVIHHLYVCHVESKEFQRHILFRNYLRKNVIARNCYRDMKYACAIEANNDKSLYAEIKQNKINNFIDYIIELEKNNFGEK